MVAAPDEVVATGTALVSALLITGGVHKILSPGVAADAIRRTLKIQRRRDSGVRAFASLELGAGMFSVFPTTRALGLGLAACCGIGFSVIGAVAYLTRARMPCGCLGPKPMQLGLLNVTLGIAISAICLQALLVDGRATAAGIAITALAMAAIMAYQQANTLRSGVVVLARRLT